MSKQGVGGGITHEMKVKGRAYHKWRYRRFQALDDALTIFLHLQDHPHWFSTTDVIEFMEWNNNPATRKRVRRIGESLVRLERVETKNTTGGSPSHPERIWRILE